MEYPGVRLGQRGGLYDLYQYYLGGGDQATGDEGPVTTVSMPVTTGGGQTNSMGVDLNRIRQPTGSPFRTDIPNVTDTGEKFSDLPTTDPRYMSEAEQIFLQNRADAGAYAYDSPMYTGGAPGNITQTGPGREFIYDNTGKSYDDMAIMTGVEDGDPSLIAKIRQGILDNPLFATAASFANPFVTAGRGILDAFGNMIPINARAIQEKEGLTQGLAIDDIGRVAFQDFGIRENGTYGALSRDDPRNIFAGLNYSMIDQDTIDKMKGRINKSIAKTKDQGKINNLKKRLSIIDDAWNTKQMADSEAEKIISRREYQRREEKRAKIQKDLAAAGFGESGAVGISDEMDQQIFDDYSYKPGGITQTIVPPRKPRPTIQDTNRDDRRAPPSKTSNVPQGIKEDTPGSGEFGGGASYSSAKAGTSAGKSSSKGRSDGGWGWKDGGLVQRKPYGDGGIVDLL